MLTRRVAALSAMVMFFGQATPLAAAERIAMPQGALLCKTIDPAIEHARLVRQPTTEGLRPFVESAVARGQCRVMKTETPVDVVDVDRRGFALVQDDGSQWWTDAENLWGYFDTPAKVKAWTKP